MTVHHDLLCTVPKQSPSTNGQSGQMAWTRNRECVATDFDLINVTSSLIILGKSKPETVSIQIRSINP